MINLKCRTEFSFRTAYGKVEQILDAGGVGICDRHGTWGHVQFAKAAKKKGIKPVFGVELAVVQDSDLKEKQGINYMSLIALNDKGLRQIYELTTLATEKTYYIPRIDYGTLYDTTDDIVILSGTIPTLGSLPRQKNILIELSPLSTPRLQEFAREKGYRTIATSDNFFPKLEDKRIYEIVAGDNKDSRTVPQHLLDEWEWADALPWADKAAIETAKEIYASCTAVLPVAEMVHYETKDTLFDMCRHGAVKRGLDIVQNLQYKDRLFRELELIKQKQFEDYFYVIADMVNFAKNHMLVGPARGSSCGSLVCYLLGITDIDPLSHHLLFERFIDITREDLPDIDIDFQDDRRELVFDYLREKYGADKVARLGTVSRYKAKSTIVDVSKELNIPPYEVHDLKEAIIERSGGDSRASFCIIDTLNTLDVGKAVLAKFPEIAIAGEIEGHARHSGQHAAGIIVTAHPITHYCSVDKKNGGAMIDKKDAEELGLLKIDALGLRTLSVLQDVLDSVGWTRQQLLEWPTNDEEAFQVIRDEKFSGIFQFEGFALKNICRQMPITEFNDLAVITALARPGPLTSGGTTEFVRRRTGKVTTTYLHPIAKEITEDTYGVIIYQEQVMQVARLVGKLSWEDVSNLRKAMSKSLGKEFFDTFKVRFLAGAKENGIETKEATFIWENINTMGSWAFNKCIFGGTKIKLANAGSNLKDCTISELYERYVAKPSPWIKQRKSMPWLVSLNNDGVGVPQKVKTIHKNGKKHCWGYLFDDASEVICTKDHKFLINNEWKRIGESKIGDNFTCLKQTPNSYEKRGIVSKGKKYKINKEGFAFGENNPGYINGKTKAEKNFVIKNKNESCQDCNKKSKRMEVHHNDFNDGLIEPNNLSWLCSGCHKKRHYENNRNKRWSKGHKIYTKKLVKKVYMGIEETYDIEMEKYHNYTLQNDIVTHNSHAVAYGLVSYWCCVLKAKFPLEFAAACLRNSKSEEQVVQFIRELVREGFKWRVFDKDKSKKNWSVVDGEIVGGYLNLKGCGDKMADDIIKRKDAGVSLTNRQLAIISNPLTPFDNVFECQEKWHDIYENWKNHSLPYAPCEIHDITETEDGECIFIGKLLTKNLRDLNDAIFVQKRNGRRVTGEFTQMLNCTVGDDTGSIRISIDRYKYQRWGKPIVESGQIGDWYIFKGEVKKGFLQVRIEKWRKL